MIQSIIILDPKAEISAKQDVDALVLQSEDGRDIGIEEVRRFIAWAGQTSFAGGQKLGIIIQAQRLSLVAQQALLKTLEEPVVDTRIILTVNQPASLLPTIISRCAVIDPSADNDRILPELALTRNLTVDAPEVLMGFAQVCHQPASKRWQMMDQIVSTKGSLALHLQAWQGELTDQLRQSTQPQTVLVQQLALLDQCQMALSQNVSPRLVADLLLLQLA